MEYGNMETRGEYMELSNGGIKDMESIEKAKQEKEYGIGACGCGRNNVKIFRSQVMVV